MTQRHLIPRSFSSLLDPFLEEENWLPSLNFSQESGLTVAEDQKHVTVEAALPGLKPEEVEITFEKGTLWIRGQHQEQEQDKEKKYYRRAARSFSYHVQVPGNINESAEPSATFCDGVIKVAFQKAEKDQPRKIQIKKS